MADLTNTWEIVLRQVQADIDHGTWASDVDEAELLGFVIAHVNQALKRAQVCRGQQFQSTGPVKKYENFLLLFWKLGIVIFHWH